MNQRPKTYAAHFREYIDPHPVDSVEIEIFDSGCEATNRCNAAYLAAKEFQSRGWYRGGVVHIEIDGTVYEINMDNLRQLPGMTGLS